MDRTIYGANGYTGELIAREAKKCKIPCFSGRNVQRIAKVASELARTSRDFPSIRHKRSRSAAGRPPRVGSRGSFSEDGQTLDAGIAAKALRREAIEPSLGLDLSNRRLFPNRFQLLGDCRIFAVGCCSRKLLDAGSAHGGRLHLALARTEGRFVASNGVEEAISRYGPPIGKHDGAFGQAKLEDAARR